jgi:hypothetical protein
MKAFRKIQTVAIVAAAIGSFTIAEQLLSQVPDATARNVLYTATGNFASPAISGRDIYKLAGEPFNITLKVNAATVPHAHGKGWADYTDQVLRGVVHSGLDTRGVKIASNVAFLALAIGNPSYDLFELQAPVHVITSNITLKATIQMPVGTITKWTIRPFNNPVTLERGTGMTVTYTTTTDTTMLQFANGTLNAAFPTGSSTN